MNKRSPVLFSTLNKTSLVKWINENPSLVSWETESNISSHGIFEGDEMLSKSEELELLETWAGELLDDFCIDDGLSEGIDIGNSSVSLERDMKRKEDNPTRMMRLTATILVKWFFDCELAASKEESTRFEESFFLLQLSWGDDWNHPASNNPPIDNHVN